MTESYEYTIRNLIPSDAQTVFDWCASEGWNPGVAESPAYFALDPNGLFVGECDGQAVACVFGVELGTSLAHMGNYLVLPAYRGHGLGREIFEYALARIANRPVGLESVMAQIETYEKLGFQRFARTFRYGFRPEGEAPPRKCDLIPLTQIPVREIVERDAETFGAERPRFLEEWWRIPGSKGIAAVSGSRLVGFGHIRPACREFKIGPLVASSPATAAELAWALCRAAGASEALIDMCAANPQADALVRELELFEVFETARMYRGRPPQIGWSQNFGMASMEVG